MGSTGKTRTLASIIAELHTRGQRLLVTSTTNAAVDEALAKDHSWLWAWANEASGLPDLVLKGSRRLRAFGIQRGIEMFTNRAFSLGKLSGHQIAMGVLGAARKRALLPWPLRRRSALFHSEAVVREGAIGDEVRIATRAAVSALSGAGAKVIVCTCSTLGGIAEQSPPAGVLVLRIDRAMAERAVASGRRILVAAALASTLSPTVELLRQIAHESGRTLELVEVLCEGAWPLFEAGDLSAYASRIARAIEREAHAGDTVVLAQASMAPASDLLRHLEISVLSSPRLGVEAALSRYRALAEVGPFVSRVGPLRQLR